MARPRSDIAPRIVHAARDKFLANGVDGASLRDIARSAHTSIGMIYYYFPTKDDLFLAVVEEAYVKILERLATALGRDVSVRERLVRLYRVFGTLDREEQQVIQLVVREAIVSSSRLDRLIERFRRGHVQMVFETVLEGMSDGTFNPELHPVLVMMSVFALGGPAQVVRRIAGEKGAFAGAPKGDDLSDRLVEILLAGTGCAATSPREKQSAKRRRTP